MYKSKVQKMPRVLTVVLMNVLQRSMIREMMDLNRELGSPLMICSFCWVHMDSALVNGNVLNVNGHLCFGILGDAETKCPIP